MSVQDCLVRLMAAAKESGLKLSRETMESFALQLENLGASNMGKEDFAKSAGVLFEEYGKRYAEKKSAERALNTATVMSASLAIRKGKLGGKNVVENILNFVHGGALRKSEGGRIDPARLGATISKSLQNFWDTAVKPYRSILERKLLIDEIFQERDAINRGLPLGKSGSKDAVEIAKGMFGTQNQIFDLKKANNPFIEKNAEFLANRFHDREKIAAVPRDQWVADAMASFGEKSFAEASPEQKKVMLGNIYDRITDGSYATILDDEDAGKHVVGDTLTANILRRMAKERTLVANDWKAEAEYFKKYGPETIGDLMGRVIDRAGKDIAILKKFGSNPKENFTAIFNDVYARSTRDQQAELRSSQREIMSNFAQVTGEADAPARNALGKTTRGILNSIYAAKTGLAILRMLPDLGLSGGVVRGLNGKTVAGNAFDITTAYMKAFTSTAAREQGMKDLYLFSTSARASIMGGLGAPGVDGGILGNIAEKVGTLGLHQRHVEAMKVAIGSVISRDLGRMSETAFAELPARFKNGLQSYGIGEHEWNLLKDSREQWSDKGALEGKFMTPDGVSQASDEAVTKYMQAKGLVAQGQNPSKEAIFQSRKNVEFALGTMINDHADYGSTTAGSRQRGWMYKGTDINSQEGAARRILFQFKSAAITSYDAYRRLYYSGEGPRGDWAGVAQTMAAVTFWWTVGELAKQTLEGKTPEDPTTPDFAIRAIISSGAGGLAADVVQGAMRANGVMGRAGGAILGLAGPGVSEFGKAVGLTGEYIQGLSQKYNSTGPGKLPNRQLLDFVQGNVPMQNLMGVNSVLNYYILNGFKDFLDTGYLGHLERNVTKTPGLLEDRQRYFMFNPAESPRWMQ
jgi:hypothetical protein